METVEIVRCIDCIHATVFPNGCNISCDLHYDHMDASGFCSDGEPKEKET